jgi:O-antigen/teichoic acid export membrane protein
MSGQRTEDSLTAVGESNGSSGRRLSLITLDEIVGGASNVLTAVLAARLLTSSFFGLFGVVFLLYSLLLAVTRALVNDPLLIHPVEGNERPNDVIDTNLVLGLGLGALTVVAGVVASGFSGEFGRALIVLAVCFPLLALQDLGRYFGFGSQRPGRALALDTLWLVLLIAAVAVLLAVHRRSLVWFILAWAGSGALSGLLLLRHYPGYRPRCSLSWLRYTWQFSWRYLVSYGSTYGAALANTSAVGSVVGTRQLGGVQGTVLLVRPFGAFQAAALAAGVSDIARVQGNRAVRRHSLRATALAAGVAALNGIVLLALPDRLGRIVLGHTWALSKPLLLPTSVQILAMGVFTGARAGLLGIRLIRRAMVIDIVGTVLLLSGAVSGAVIHGAKGALWGSALAASCNAVTWWLVLLASTATADSAPDEGGPAESVVAGGSAAAAAPPPA